MVGNRVVVEEIDSIASNELLEAIAHFPYSFFLDSGSGIYKSDLGRYSLAGWNPFQVMATCPRPLLTSFAYYSFSLTCCCMLR